MGVASRGSGEGGRTVPAQRGLVVDVVAQHGLGVIEQGGGFLGAAGPVDDFLQQVGVVSPCCLDEELAGCCALCVC